MQPPVANPQMLIACSSTRTHTGHQRTVNEDSAFSDSARGLWVVADGMGGYAAGDVASRQVVQLLGSVSLHGSVASCITQLEAAIQGANRQLLFDTTLPPGCRQLGTTVVVLFYHPVENCCVCLWVGDSRVYVLRDQQLIQLTRDHSVVQEMVDNGLLEESRRDSHPQSHIITRAVGIDSELQIDMISFEPAVGDTYVLCSDGLYNEICMVDQLQACHCHSITDAGLRSEHLAESLLTAVLGTHARDNVTLTVIAME